MEAFYIFRLYNKIFKFSYYKNTRKPESNSFTEDTQPFNEIVILVLFSDIILVYK